MRIREAGSTALRFVSHHASQSYVAQGTRRLRGPADFCSEHFRARRAADIRRRLHLIKNRECSSKQRNRTWAKGRRSRKRRVALRYKLVRELVRQVALCVTITKSAQWLPPKNEVLCEPLFAAFAGHNIILNFSLWVANEITLHRSTPLSRG